MAAEVWVAVIAGGVALVSAAVTIWGQRSTVHLQAAATKETQSRELLTAYREPLLRAAFDLQSRLYNIVAQGFLSAYPPSAHRGYSRRSTLWLVAQYFGWVEIVRSEIQFLDLGTAAKNRTLVELLTAVSNTFASDTTIQEPVFRVFRAEQRAIGELMIVRSSSESERGRRSDCLGYATFCERLRTGGFDDWLESLSGDLEVLATDKARATRLVHLQRALIDLIWFLDEDRYRFVPDQVGKLLVEPRLPIGVVKEPGTRFRHARFNVPFEPWSDVLVWCHAHSYKPQPHGAEDATRRFVQQQGAVVRHVVEVTYESDRMAIASWIEIGLPRFHERRIEGIRDRGIVLRGNRRDAIRAINDLLRRFGRPELPEVPS